MPKGKAKRDETIVESCPTRPALSLEAQENYMIHLATNLAEKKLREGTASSQLITHYLKLGTTREKIEKEILENQKELIQAKTDALKASEDIKELYTNAIDAMKRYSGHYDEGEEY